MAIALLTGLVLFVLASLHFHWAAGGKVPSDAVIPHRDGRPLLRPGRGGSALVGVLLCGAGALVIAVAGGIGGDWPIRFCFALAGVMLLRAAGDFRYVGFFKQVREGRFAALDTKFYSPLCLALAAGAGWTAWTALK